MAGLKEVLTLSRIPKNSTSAITKPNNTRGIVSTTEYYIRYECGECNRTHSVLAKVRKHKAGNYTILNSLGNIVISVPMSKISHEGLYRASLKLLDALNIDFDPKSLRVVKV